MENKTGLALPTKNLKLLAIGLGIIIIGFICMIGGNNDGTFDPEIFSPMRITIGPMISLFGFFFEIFAILWMPNKEREE
ncbi:MAG: DUF3098 domain-containing protein [Paludibacteraceae bacterium]|nr:DUF3098 domain-containing protein [Paludibacteraceae bacterium]MBP5456096.1 DUF3098 domain-containing protein [Paludibacteraceae bacterium]MBR4841333.1 DUF3098 domain-containing protein [Paludibacteraceae bacterium]